MKIIKTLTDDWDIVGGLYNFYTIDEVKQYIKENNLKVKEIEEMGYGDDTAVGIAIDLDNTLDDIDITSGWDYDFVFEGEFDEATKEYINKYKLYTYEMNNEELFQLIRELYEYNNRDVEDVYNKIKLIIENGDKFKKLFKQFNLK